MFAPFRHNVDAFDHARTFHVTDAGTNNVSVEAGRFRFDQTVTNFAAATALGPLADGTHFVYITSAGVITSLLGGPYPANSCPLARVVVAGGDVTGITDDRCFFALEAGGGGAPHALLSATHTDTLPAAVVDGDIVIGGVAPVWARLPIAIPAANVRNVLGVDNGELRPSWKAALDAVNPAAIAAAAAPGTSLIFSHRDHIHAHPDIVADLHSVYFLASGARAATGNLDFAAFYQDIGEIAVPANPGANIRRLFVDNATGEISVRTNAGATVSLEGGGGGGTLDAAYDFGGAGAGRIITVDSGAVELRHTADLTMLATRDPGDAVDRFALSRDGTMSWGSGAGAADIVLSRAAANRLAFAAADILSVQYIADTAGNTRIATAAAPFNVVITGNIQFTAPGTVSSVINAQVAYSVPAGGGVGIALSPAMTCVVGDFFVGCIGMQGLVTAVVNNTAFGFVYGLSYIAGVRNAAATSTIVEQIGEILNWQTIVTAGTLNITDGGGVKVNSPSIGAGAASTNITRNSGVWIENQGHTRMATSYAIRIEAQSGSSVVSYGIYIENATTYAVFVDAGLARFDGDGTDVFELPVNAVDPTGGGGAALGRIPCSIGGVTRHLAYY